MKDLKFTKEEKRILTIIDNTKESITNLNAMLVVHITESLTNLDLISYLLIDNAKNRTSQGDTSKNTGKYHED